MQPTALSSTSSSAESQALQLPELEMPETVRLFMRALVKRPLSDKGWTGWSVGSIRRGIAFDSSHLPLPLFELN